MRKEIKFNAGIIIYKGKAYLETKANTDQGMTILIDPVYVVERSVDEIETILKEMIKAGNPVVPHPKDLNKIKQVTLIATKTKSWKELAKRAAAYSIVFRTDDIMLSMSRPNSKFEWDSTRGRIFPIDTDLKIIIQAILDDARSRPEVLN
jgi:hypothetical protein